MSFMQAVAPPSNSRPAVRLATLLVVVWLIAMAQLIWHFESQRIAQFQRLLHFDAVDLPAPPPTIADAAKVLYFFNRSCRCNAAALAEVAGLQRSGVLPRAQFVFDDSAMTDSGIEARALSAAERTIWRDHVPATPAVALWDAHDKLIYFGPINVSSGCGTGDGYLRNALRTMHDGSVAPFKSWDVVACSCPAVATYS